MPRLRRLLWAALPLGLLYLAFSFHRLESTDLLYVIETVRFGGPPAVAHPGWHFVPRFIGRVASYPAGPVCARIEMKGESAAVTPEGARIGLTLDLTYSIELESLLDLHRRRGPTFESSWLADEARRVARSVIGRRGFDPGIWREGETQRSAQSAIGRSVAEDGIRVERLRFLPIDVPVGGAEPIVRVGAPVLERTVVLIGVDAFDWTLIDPLLRSGRMPNLARLVERGARANLRTLRPILSPVVWTSIATGMRPSRHGVVDFVVTARDSGALIPVTSSVRRVPALWEILGAQGVDVSVVAWWATWPATPVPGKMVTDRVAYQLYRGALGEEDWSSDDPEADRGKTHPPDLIETIRPLIREPSEVSDDAIAPFLGDGKVPENLTEDQRGRLDELRTVLAAGTTYHAIAGHLFREAGPGFRTVYYEAPDTAAHLFMRFRSPALAGVDPRDARLFGEVIDRIYDLHDRYIGEIVGAAGKDAIFVVVSDHGFKSGADRPLRSGSRIGEAGAADWHTPVGILVMAGPGIRSGVDLGAASVLDVTPTVLALHGLPVPRDMDGQPLTAAFEPVYLEEHPLGWIDTYGGRRDADLQPDLPAPQDAAILEKLRNLGYIGEERLAAHNNRGLVALDEGEIDDAIGHFERARQSDEASPTVILNNLAEAWRRKGDPDRARRFAREALAADAGNKQAEMILARIEESGGRHADAERHLRRALEIDPGFAQAHARLGALLEARGDDAAALAAYRRAVAITPLSPDEYTRIGEIHRRRGELDRAVEAFEEALRCDARHVAALNNLGLTLQEMGRFDEARRLYARGLTIRPRDPILRNSLGSLLALRGETEAAIAELEIAVAVEPDWPIARGNLAMLLAPSTRAAEAGAHFERWISLEPESPAARIGYGEWLLHRGDLAAARARLDEGARMAPGDARVHALLGEVLIRLGLPEEGAGALRRSLAIDPAQESVRRRLDEAGG